MNAPAAKGVATRIAWKPAVCDDHGVPLRVLIVDDHPGFRARARALLESEGFEVVGEAGDGDEAVARAPECAPEVVLLDLNMPKVNGFEALPRLRDALGPETAIVVLTTGQAPDERRLALAAGADGFIVKPERVFTLDERLRGALQPGAAG
jgi:DNA-binding NarL/FixJ family response regulator